MAQPVERGEPSPGVDSVAAIHTAANGPVPCSPYSSILIEQSQPFIVDELVKAAQLRSQAITDKSKAHWTGEAGHLPVTLWPGPREAG